MGYGGRWQPEVRNKDSPSPGAYEIRSSLNTGHAMRYKEPVPRNLESRQGMPGPGAYEIVQPIGKHAPKISFRARHVDVRYSESPSPHAYSPSLLPTGAFRGIGFGFGGREFMKNVTSDSPGPGCYDLASIFAATPKKKKLVSISETLRR